MKTREKVKRFLSVFHFSKDSLLIETSEIQGFEATKNNTESQSMISNSLKTLGYEKRSDTNGAIKTHNERGIMILLPCKAKTIKDLLFHSDSFKE